MSIRVRLRSALRLLAVLACALLAGCATTQSGITRGLILVPKSMEISLGKAVADEVIGEYGLMDDEVIGGYVSDVGTRLTAVCDRRDLNYSFRVLDTPMVNAFACPGGFVFVTRGLLERCDNEAELATVMAHEVGHVCAYHSVKNLQAQLGYAVVASVLYYNSDNPHRDAIADYANIAYQLMQLGYSRGDEYQADQLGLYYAAHAGYDPYQMETFFRKLIEENGETPRLLVWLSTHPATGDRIARIPKVVEALGLGQNAAPDVGEQRYREMVRARLDGNLENPVRDAFQEAMVALRTEDLAAFMALVADDYRAADGETVAGLRVRLERFFARADNLKLALGKVDVSFAGNRATVCCDCTLSFNDHDAGGALQEPGPVPAVLTFRRLTEGSDKADDRWLLVALELPLP